ncbi:class I SAM-dependent methyltransferase [Halomonas aquamarina]|uniref:Class I SAM-dependent methyltransferase n=1 Tax=Vreelandella aquamarina TaxID=77097 RepID=A0ACC5VXA2_9GAMM|nr:class I SAM-dependent methyltransferase [Halomonas aquamarina]MBZ5488359.1 class I SAM-dependent methyltransferase [Halomonas aquamarina]
MSNALYTDLSGYYDLMCVDIDYQAQSDGIRRLHQLFGNGGHTHLDLACGTGPHVRRFIEFGYSSSGLDINQPMLDIAATRCPSASFMRQDMSSFDVCEPQDLITCFLYSIHYNASIEKLNDCLLSAHRALAPGGVFCFNAVDKDKIDNALFVKHTARQGTDLFTFRSGWHYDGQGEQQSLRLSIEKADASGVQVWDDEHPMVAVRFAELVDLLEPLFEVQVFEHDYAKITPWDTASGNAIFVCVKR